jgi:SnoaL-like domain
MPAIDEIAREFTAMLRDGRFEAAGDRFWAADVTSIEPIGIAPIASGIAAARRKCAARFGAGRIEDLGIDGPFVTGNQFALFLDMVIVEPASGRRQPFTEIALYTVRGGQIAEERYFYD